MINNTYSLCFCKKLKSLCWSEEKPNEESLKKSLDRALTDKLRHSK